MTLARTDLGAEHHALLFSWIARAVVERCGVERGEEVVRMAVRRYGEQRGGRMALRARARGHALSMLNFVAYGEWRAAPGETARTIVERTPHFSVHVSRCPWHRTWEENALLDYGRYYCLEIDHALVRGFNPELELEVNGTQVDGAERCEFVYRGLRLTPVNALLLRYRLSLRPGERAVMPWEYHIGHLYKTMGEVVVEQLGEMGREAVVAALAEFSDRYGAEAADAIKSYQDVDFCLVE